MEIMPLNSDDIVMSVWNEVIRQIEYENKALSSEKTLVFLFAEEMKKIVGDHLQFDFEYPAYMNMPNHKFLDLLLWTNDKYKVAFEFKLPKSSFQREKGYNNSNQTKVKENMYRDIARLYYLTQNRINNIKVGYFLCAANEYPYFNKLRSKTPYMVHHNFVNDSVTEISGLKLPPSIRFYWDHIGVSRYRRHHQGYIPKYGYGWLRPIKISDRAETLEGSPVALPIRETVTHGDKRDDDPESLFIV